MLPIPLAIAGALLASAPAAEEPLDEVVVMATRRVSNASEISATVSTVNREQLLGEKLATDGLRSLLGVSVQQTTPGQGAAIIRGLKGSAILHLVDGMRLSNAMFRTAPTPWFALVPSTSIERLEVIRGTPASLYGSEAVGGVVQSVSRLPHFDSDTLEHAGDVVVSFDSAELQRSVQATFDAGTHRLAASLSAEYLETGNRRVGGGVRIAPTGYTSKGLRAVIHGTPTEDRSWFVDFQFLEQPEVPRIDELVPGFGQTEPSSSEFLFAPNRRVFAHVQHDMISQSGIDWKVDAAWQRIDDDRITRNLGAIERRYEKNRSDLFGLTVNASGENGRLSWIAGTDLYYDEVRSSRVEEDTSTGVFATLTPRFPDGSTVTHAGLFVNAEWPITDRQNLSAGIRYSDVHIELPDGTTINPGRLSGDLGWVFDASDVWQLVANIGRGFRAPNIADLGTLGNRPGNRFNTPNTGLDAETVSHGDLGLRYHGDRWRIELAAFALRYSDRIVSVSTGDITPDGRDIVQSVNAATSSIRGLEAGITADLSNRATLSATVNVARGDQRVADTEEPADRVPPVNGRVALGYALNDRWQFGAWLVAATAQNRLSARDIRDIRIDPNGTPGWVTLGAKTTWQDDSGWRVTLGVDNVFDTRHREHGSGLDRPGRNVFLMMRRHW